jgi:DNA-binding transcriptional regulator YdaS (Cro superfamily)
MRTADVIAFYKTQTKVADVLGIWKQAVNQWGEFVPEGKARRLEKLTRGKLKVIESAYKRSSIRNGIAKHTEHKRPKTSNREDGSSVTLKKDAVLPC